MSRTKSKTPSRQPSKAVTRARKDLGERPTMLSGVPVFYASPKFEAAINSAYIEMIAYPAARFFAAGWRRAAKAERERHHWFFKCYAELRDEILRSASQRNAERDALRAAAKLARDWLAQWEYIRLSDSSNPQFHSCLWCGNYLGTGHKDTCTRQLTLAALDAALGDKS